MSAHRRRATAEQRFHFRFDKVFPVIIASDDFGESDAVARNISVGGMLVEMADPLPIGADVTVFFEFPGESGDIAARAQVRHHYCFNFQDPQGPAASRGVGLRFIEFLHDPPRRWLQSLAPPRILH